MSDPMGLAAYVRLLEEFVYGRMSAVSFEQVYLSMFKEDKLQRPEQVYNALNTLFRSVDDYVADSAIRDAGDLDDGQLREAAAEALDELDRLWTRRAMGD